MRLVLSTDYHLSFSAQLDNINSDGLSTRLSEILTSIKWAADIGIQNKADAFIALGDIFDRPEKIPTKEGQHILDAFKYIRSNYPKHTLFLAGNHDQVSREYNILELFASKDTLSVVSKPTILDIDDKSRLFFLPYIREVEDIYAAIEELTKFDCPKKKYLFAHFWDTSTIAVDPGSVDLSKINSNFFDRIFLGHFHVPTKNHKEKVIYLGTLLNKKFNETGPKGCWILDTAKNTIKFIVNPHSPEFLSVDDVGILANAATLDKNAYYRVQCEPDNILEVSKLLSASKGFEILNKRQLDPQSFISIDHIEKKNALSLRDYIIKNCNLYLPDGVTEAEFKEKGLELLKDL